MLKFQLAVISLLISSFVLIFIPAIEATAAERRKIFRAGAKTKGACLNLKPHSTECACAVVPPKENHWPGDCSQEKACVDATGDLKFTACEPNADSTRWAREGAKRSDVCKWNNGKCEKNSAIWTDSCKMHVDAEANRKAVVCQANKDAKKKASLTDAEESELCNQIETQAKEYWTLKGKGAYKKGELAGKVKILYSFGSKDTLTDEERLGFHRVFALSSKMGADAAGYSTGRGMGMCGTGKNMGAAYYVDAKALATLPGAYWKPAAGKDPGAFTLNLFWDSYYQEAMDEAKMVVFLLTEGWFKSPNCGEELDWAKAMKEKKKDKFQTMVVFLDQYSKTEFAKATSTDPSKSTAAKWTALVGTDATRQVEMFGKLAVNKMGGAAPTAAETQNIAAIAKAIKTVFDTLK